MKHQAYPKDPGPDGSEERIDEVIGTKELYNWLYQKEEEDYYSSQLKHIDRRGYGGGVIDRYTYTRC